MAVPNLPGVPPLLNYAIGQFVSSLLTSDGPFVYSFALPTQWGIFLGGAPVITADTVATFNYKQEWSIADYPVEEGAFATYDKVQIPFDVRFRFVAGGSEANRANLLNSVDAAASDKTTLFDAVTPEKVYPSITISHYDYSRTSVNGVGMIQVDVWCFNVVVLGGNNFSSISPSAANPSNDGTVNTTSSPGAGISAPAFPGGNPTNSIVVVAR